MARLNLYIPDRFYKSVPKLNKMLRQRHSTLSQWFIAAVERELLNMTYRARAERSSMGPK